MPLSYERQLEQKRERVTKALSLFAGPLPSVGDVAPAEPRSHYRTRAKLVVGARGDLGLFASGKDHEVVDIPGCIVLSPLLARVAATIRAQLAAGALPPRGREGVGGVTAVDLREAAPPGGDGARALVTFVVERGTAVRLEGVREAAEALRNEVPEVLGVAVSYSEPRAVQLLGSEPHVLSGKRSLVDTIGASTHRATFGSFVQAHRGQALAIHDAIARAILPGGAEGAPPLRVLDLYGGSGAIALSLAGRGAVVHMVESFSPAAQAAVEEARERALSLTAEAADVKDALERFGKRRPLFDAVVVNPPRRGLDAAVRARVARLSPRILVYVSCAPETLARDLDHFARLGLAATEVRAFDMIPLTREVETLAILRPASPREPTVLYEDDEVVAVDKPPHTPTTPQGEHEGSLLLRVQARRGASGAAPVQRLDVGTSGVVLFAKEPSFVDGWSRALADDGAQKTYLAGAVGVLEERGSIDTPLVIDGKKKSARTRFERVEALGHHTLLRVVPEQGRTHQIRRHLASVGHPILGDERYGHAASNRFFFEKHGLDRTFLHATRVELRHPTTGKRLVLDAPLPGDLEAVRRSVGGQ